MTKGPFYSNEPRLRCMVVVQNPELPWCGQPAVAFRPACGQELDAYVCDAHRQREDLPLPHAGTMRRVRLDVHVYFAAVTLAAVPAQIEALKRLEHALKAVGGLPIVQSVTSSKGRYAAQAGNSSPTASPPPTEGR